jgi:hypothetical protein
MSTISNFSDAGASWITAFATLRVKDSRRKLPMRTATVR